MKLSEAIREGSKLHPQCPRGHTDRVEGQLRTCAIMAASFAQGLWREDPNSPTGVAPCGEVEYVTDARTGMSARMVRGPSEWWPTGEWLSVSPCPCKIEGTTETIIWHLNDVHQMSREAVAEWVEVVENEIERRKGVLCPGWGGRESVKVEALEPALVS